MNSRRMEFFIGMMVIGIIAGVFVMTLMFHSGKGGPFIGRKGGARVEIRFKDGAGINTNSLVLKNGVRIGRVYDVRLKDEPGQSEVSVKFELEPEATIYTNELARITRTLMGDASIEIIDNSSYVGKIEPVKDGAVIASTKAGDLMNTVSNLEGDLGAALQNVNSATAGVAEFMQKANAFLGDDASIQEKSERLKGVFTEVKDTLETVRLLAAHMNEIVTDSELKEKITETADRIPQILANVESMSSKADQFMDKAGGVTDELKATLDGAHKTLALADQNLMSLDTFTKDLARQGPEIMTSVNEGAAELKGAIDEAKLALKNISQLAETLGGQIEGADGDTPVGLLTDKQLASDIRKIVSNAEELTEKLYPIFDDARVFSNKIAHKPSSLIWDKTTSKGGTLSEKFGWQTKSPSGGVNSPLYRQTPAGSCIRERNYYNPAADADFMDAKTRAVYETELANRNAAQRANDELSAFANAYANGGYSGVVPETKGFLSGRGDVAGKMKAQTSRIRWSLDSFFSKFTPKRGPRANGTSAEYVQYANMPGATVIGVDGFAPMGAIDQTAYLQGGAFESAAPFVQNGAYVEAGMSECGVPSCAPQPTCAVPSCAPQPTCDVPNCNGQPNCAGAGPTGAGQTTGYGYRPETANAYRGEEPKQMTLSAETSGETIEELPSSINRPSSGNAGASNAASMSGSAFEDDGLPLQFAPPSQR